MLPTKFQLIWPNGFREDFLIGQSQTRTAYGDHGNFVQAKWFQRKRLFFRNQPTRNNNCPYIYMVAMFVNGSERNEQS